MRRYEFQRLPTGMIKEIKVPVEEEMNDMGGEFHGVKVGKKGELWCYGVVELWSFGVVEIWSYGVVELWSYGVVELWSYGVVELWETL